ncbi:MAG: hypothetical protein JNM56_17605 [Planctomycetia bacterium]|nr:hypothetical protein [Planctomycetia bacterium]
MRTATTTADALPAVRRLALLLLLLGGCCLTLRAQPLGDEPRPLPTRDRTFRIPFQTQPGERRLREVQLHYSTDQGHTWRQYGLARPEDGSFQPFTAAADGLYWFSVRTIDLQGRAYPLADSELRPALKVLVDTQPPRVALRSLPAQGQNVGVEWDIRDDNLDLNSLRLEYLAAGASQYVPLRIDAVASGQHYFAPATNGPLEVRLSASDTAGNVGQDRAIVTPGGAPFGGQPANAQPYNPQPANPQPPFNPQPAQPAVRMVNSKRISLNYKIDDVGPSGVAAIELWYTQDARTWNKHGEDTNAKPPYVVDVNDEGLYGFSLVARSGVGLSDRAPQMGDQPHIWVEVDLTRPVVRLLAADVGRGPETGNLSIAWSASDKNLTRQPISLSFSESGEGEWKPIAQNLDNTGRYVWRMPPSGVPFRFHIRVDAADKAGNVGSAQTTQHVIVDLAKPKPTILDVGSASK